MPLHGRLALGDSVLGCSSYDETLFAERALHAGTMGYVNKREATSTIVKAIRQIHDGKVDLSDPMLDRLSHRLSGRRDTVQRPVVDVLSDRELEVFRMIGNGLTLLQIARKVYIGVKTVETHKRRIKQKLKLENTAQLARNAAQWALKNG
jgi:DNA-binding NarL/FixJ family response regulator